MKLKYYLRGLGIGMTVTALLMGFATRESLPLTDAEIKARARALGMVESDSVQLSDIRQSDNGQELPDSSGEIPKASASETGIPGVSEQESAGQETEQESSEQESAGQETEQESSEQESVGQETEQESSLQESMEGEAQCVTIVVNRGYSSDKVSHILADAGLVKDAGLFDKYLVENGYATRIRVGTYEIRMGTAEERIAGILTGAE